MYPLKCAVALLAVLVTVGAIHHQSQAFAPDRLSISLGATETPQVDRGQPKLALYPELELHFGLGKWEAPGLVLGGAVYAAGWTDGVRSISECADCITYSYTSGVVGMRAIVELDRLPIPVHLWTGITGNALWADYIGGAGIDGRPGRDHHRTYTAGEFGAGLRVRIANRTSVRLTSHVQIPFVNLQDPVFRPRFASGIGIAYSV